MISQDIIFGKLNEQQKIAVETTEGPLLVFAGAGSGKTRVLVYKVLWLLHEKKIDPSTILMVTFTNKAAGEMKSRVGVSLGFIGTFHSLCAYILRRNSTYCNLDSNFIIYDEDDKKAIIKKLITEYSSNRKLTYSAVSSRISSAKDNLITPKEYKALIKNEYDTDMYTIYVQYQQKLETSNAVDFDDLIVKTVELFQNNINVLSKYQSIFKYILVDEFQDTNFSQYILCKLIAQKHQNITVVGDFSQSIYSWRGADITNLTKFERDFAPVAVFNLIINYRSTQNILQFANDVISHNQSHPILKLQTDNQEGEEVEVISHYNEADEALFVVSEIEKKIELGIEVDSIAVLYRMNAQSRIIEEAFLHAGIPYILIGGVRFYERKEIKDLISYLRYLLNDKDEISKQRILKLGKKTFEKFIYLCTRLRKKITTLTSQEILEDILQSTGYIDRYDELVPEEASRIENIKELLSVAHTYQKLPEFLEQIALVESEYAQSEKTQKSGVRLMTLHQSKGLEFPIVFIIGLEEGILPHARSMYDILSLEEERRLFYVGITRAREKVYITYAQKRFMFGRGGISQISRFLEPNSEYIDTIPKTF